MGIVSILIPTLNEEASLPATLAALSRLNPHEIIVADGGSTDRTAAIAAPYARVIKTPPGRGSQLRAAAEIATGNVLWFVHADTLPCPQALHAIGECLQDPRVPGGNFTLLFDGDSNAARQLTRVYPWLRRIGLIYGDSGIFLRRSAYLQLGGIQPYPVFEDLDLVRRARRLGPFPTLAATLTTSSRRFENRNFASMFAQWTALQVLFWAGVSPHRLASLYRPVRAQR